MSSRPISLLLLRIASAVTFTACLPAAPDDPNDPGAFYKQAVPTLLGRNLRNANEAEFLTDLEELAGRKQVVAMLMNEPGFEEHWARNVVDHLRLQRGGKREADADCFGPPIRLAEGSDGGELAAGIRDHSPSVILGPAFNFTDVLLSAIALDDLSVVYKAFMVPMSAGQESAGSGTVGRAFVADYLNRDLECSACHRVGISPSPQVDFGILLEHSALGHDVFIAEQQGQVYSVFQQDVDGDDDLADFRPWGLPVSCGELKLEYPDGPVDLEGTWPGLVSQSAPVGVRELMGHFADGVASLEDGAVYLDSGSDLGPTMPSDQAFAFMVAATMSQRIWESVFGKPLTLAHGYARNAEQMLVHRALTQLFISSGWSLRAVLANALESELFNRRAPAHSELAEPFVLPSLFDPFLQEPGCSGNCANGQGELIRRSTPTELNARVHHALGWPLPSLFPSDSQKALAVQLDAYVSAEEPGDSSWSFQSLLAWEHHLGDCTTPSGTDDWIDALMDAVVAHTAANPDDPLRIRNVLEALKDRLVQAGRVVDPTDLPGELIPPVEPFGFGSKTPDPGPPPEELVLPEVDPAPATEREALERIFGLDLGMPVTQLSSVELEEKTRSVCGVLLKSPQFLLTGMEPPSEPFVPKLLVCLPGEPCSYAQICQHYRTALWAQGIGIQCQGRDVFVEWGGVSELQQADPVEELMLIDAQHYLDATSGQTIERLLGAGTSDSTRDALERLRDQQRPK